MRDVATAQPDCAIVDIRMPPTHTDEGIVAAQRIRELHPDVGVLVLSHHVEPGFAMRLLEEHPERSGYLLKDRVSDPAILVDALRRLAEGETVVDPTIVSRLFARRREADPARRAVRARARGSRRRRRGALERRDRPAPLHHRAHGRGAREADLPQARDRPDPRRRTGACSRCSPSCARTARERVRLPRRRRRQDLLRGRRRRPSAPVDPRWAREPADVGRPVPAFAERYRVIRYDTRGFGRTETDDVEFSNRADAIGRARPRRCGLGLPRGPVAGRHDRRSTSCSSSRTEWTRSSVSRAPSPATRPSSRQESRRLPGTRWSASGRRRTGTQLAELETQVWVDGWGQPTTRVDAQLRRQVHGWILDSTAPRTRKGSRSRSSPSGAPAGRRASADARAHRRRRRARRPRLRAAPGERRSTGRAWSSSPASRT